MQRCNIRSAAALQTCSETEMSRGSSKRQVPCDWQGGEGMCYCLAVLHQLDVDGVFALARILAVQRSSRLFTMAGHQEGLEWRRLESGCWMRGKLEAAAWS